MYRETIRQENEGAKYSGYVDKEKLYTAGQGLAKVAQILQSLERTLAKDGIAIPECPDRTHVAWTKCATYAAQVSAGDL